MNNPDQSQKATRRWKAPIALLIILVLVGFVTVGMVQAEQDKKDEAEILKVIVTATELTHGQLSIPPQVSNINGQAVIDPEIRKTMFDRIDTTLPDYYTGPLLQSMIGCMKGGIESNEMDGFADTGGGVSDIANVQIKIDGDTAIAEADMTIWSKMACLDGSIVDSQAGIHHSFTLVKDNGKWRIEAYQIDFLPGQEP